MPAFFASHDSQGNGGAATCVIGGVIEIVGACVLADDAIDVGLNGETDQL